MHVTRLRPPCGGSAEGRGPFPTSPSAGPPHGGPSKYPQPTSNTTPHQDHAQPHLRRRFTWSGTAAVCSTPAVHSIPQGRPPVSGSLITRCTLHAGPAERWAAVGRVGPLPHRRPTGPPLRWPENPHCTRLKPYIPREVLYRKPAPPVPRGKSRFDTCLPMGLVFHRPMPMGMFSTTAVQLTCLTFTCHRRAHHRHAAHYPPPMTCGRCPKDRGISPTSRRWHLEVLVARQSEWPWQSGRGPGKPKVTDRVQVASKGERVPAGVEGLAQVKDRAACCGCWERDWASCSPRVKASR